MSAARVDAFPDQRCLRALDDVVDERRVKFRDCRACRNFQRDKSGLNFGWCRAHKQHVKLYHPEGRWFSQCVFVGLRRFRDRELVDREAGAPEIGLDS